MFLLSGWQSVVFLQEHFDGQTGDGDSQQNHQQACHDPEGSVCGQQGVERFRQQGEEIGDAMDHHGDCEIVGPPIDPGQQNPDAKHQGPGIM